MKNLFIKTAVALLVAAAAFTSCDRCERVKGDPMKSLIYTLDNGLKVYMTVNKEEPRIQTYIAVRSGGKNDPHETTGLAHYFEHLMFKGSEQFGTSDYAAEKPLLDEIERLFEEYRTITDPAERLEMYRRIDSVSYEASKIAIPNEYDKLMGMIGARGTNAWTSQDETVYTEDIPSNQLENWAIVQADRFRHNVIRGFHTELEAVYEEKNMSLTSDTEKLFEALQAGLFKNHPYGTQTVLGTQEQLKNPSIVNIKNYYNTFYVPNNIAICLSGDFNPREALALVKKYFGDWAPNPDIPTLKYEAEEPITTPIEKDVYGLEAEMVALAWRLPGSRDLKATSVGEVASSVLCNGRAGLIDLDINMQQKVMQMYAFDNTQPDYSMFVTLGMPKQGQTLEQVRDLALEEVAKLAAGDFDESLLESTVNNIRLRRMRQLENNSNRARLFVEAFIAGIPWKDACKDIDRYASVTKEDVMAFAQEYLRPENFVVVYKRMGEDTSIEKISAPAITPIETNRDKSSAFLQSIQDKEVKPIEPSFPDFSKDLSAGQLAQGVNLLYKKNTLNEIATVELLYNRGKLQDPALEDAFAYLQYLGTSEMSAAEISARMYELACYFSFDCDDNSSSIMVSGLSDNVPEALGIVEKLILGAEPDEGILAALKADLFKARDDAKKSQDACFDALTDYVMHGPEYVKRTTLSSADLSSLSSEQLLGKLRELFEKGHEVLYYGPLSKEEATKTIAAAHHMADNPEPLAEEFAPTVQTPSSKVLVAPYTAANFYYYQFSNRGEKYDPAQTARIRLYNEYFGGGMNGIVFQEMREARGLAYSASARLREPSWKDGEYGFYAYIASQNDKLVKAVENFDDIINDMPESERAFDIAKQGLLSRMRTQRYRGLRLLDYYRSCRRLGLDEPLDKAVFEELQGLTLEDVKAIQKQWVAGRTYTYGILGDPADLDMPYLRMLGPVKTLTLEDIFGY